MSDRALDREVAERVLGYSFVEHRSNGRPHRYYIVDSAMYPARDGDLVLHPTIEAAWEDCPEFTVDLNYTLAVISELQLAGYAFGLYGTEGEWVASFENGAHDEHEADGETPGLAICRAALRVVEDGTLYAQGSMGY